MLEDVLLARAAGVMEQPLDDEVLLLAEDAHDVVHLEPVATSFWQTLRSPATLVAVADELAPQWGVSAHRLVTDLTPVVEALLAAGLLRTPADPTR